MSVKSNSYIDESLDIDTPEVDFTRGEVYTEAGIPASTGHI